VIKRTKMTQPPRTSETNCPAMERWKQPSVAERSAQHQDGTVMAVGRHICRKGMQSEPPSSRTEITWLIDLRCAREAIGLTMRQLNHNDSVRPLHDASESL
jgi:hypothetical protein